MIFCLKEQPCHSITPDRGMKRLSFTFRYHVTLGNKERMKIQMDFLESIFLSIPILMMCRKNIYKAKWMK